VEKVMAQNATSAFGAGVSQVDTEAFDKERNRLHAKIGQQSIELD
jgi:hypothetical protein